MLKIEAFTLGLMIEANCYLVSEDGHALVIDPGSKGRSVHKRIEEMGISTIAPGQTLSWRLTIVRCISIRWMRRCSRIRISTSARTLHRSWSRASRRC